MALRAVYFDLDGTLLDTAPDLALALNSLLKAKGRDTLPNDSIAKVVSDGANAMITLAFNQIPGDLGFDELREQLLGFYLDNLCIHTQPYPGIIELIEKLSNQGLQWGIATNKPWIYTKPLIESIKFPSEPKSIICPDHVKNRKPAADSLLLACEQLSATPDELIYIGDHKRDIECGQLADVRTIAVGYGYISETENPRQWGANYYVDEASQIWPILEPLLK